MIGQESIRKFAQPPVSGVSFAPEDGGWSNSRIGTKLMFPSNWCKLSGAIPFRKGVVMWRRKTSSTLA
jgi:hypothetical protein